MIIGSRLWGENMKKLFAAVLLMLATGAVADSKMAFSAAFEGGLIKKAEINFTNILTTGAVLMNGSPIESGRCMGAQEDAFNFIDPWLSILSAQPSVSHLSGDMRKARAGAKEAMAAQGMEPLLEIMCYISNAPADIGPKKYEDAEIFMSGKSLGVATFFNISGKGFIYSFTVKEIKK